MNAYFFNVSNEEKKNILDQHKNLYDGYVTKYNQESNQYPLYVQDLANDKMGVTVNSKGDVKNYTNFKINESPLDKIADGSTDLKNGTVNLSGDIEEEMDLDVNLMHDTYPSPNDEESEENFDEEMEDNYGQYEFDIDELEDYSSEEMGEGFDENIYDEIDEDIVDNFKDQIQESLDMFKRFKKYN
jgi:hypothetical protein